MTKSEYFQLQFQSCHGTQSFSLPTLLTNSKLIRYKAYLYIIETCVHLLSREIMITFPMSKGNTISPVAELTIRMLVMDPKKKIT